MKIVGTIRRLESYIFAITTGYINNRVDVYTAYSTDPSNPQVLQMSYLNSKKVADYNEYLVGSAYVTAHGALTKYSGNVAVVSTVLKLLESTGTMIDLVSGKTPPGEYSFADCTLTVESVNSYISTTTALPGLKYQRIISEENFRAIAAGAKRTCIKSFEELASSRDMSWYYDSKGVCKKQYKLIQTEDELYWVASELQSAIIASIDTETTGTDFYWHNGDASKRSKICGMSLSWKKDQGVYIPFMSNVFSSFDIHHVMSILYSILRSKPLVAHNGMFDFQVFYSYGYYIPITHDTLLMEFNIDPSVKRGSKGLKTLTRKYLQHSTIELDELMGGNMLPELIPDIDAELIKVYACSDTDYTLQIFYLLKPVVESMPSYKLDCKLIDILAIAEYQGAPVNMNLLKTMSKINQQNLQTVEHLMNKYLRTIGTQTLAIRAIKGIKGDEYDPPMSEVKELCEYQPFLDSIEGAFYKQTQKGVQEREALQFSASADVSYILYDLLGYPVLKSNDGSRSSDKEALGKLLNVPATEPVKFLKDDIISSARSFGVNSDEKIVSKAAFESYQYPFAYLLTVWRKLQKFATSFFAPLEAGSSDGYFYSDNSMTSAETARVINKIQTLEGSLKELIVPRNDDWYMIVFDKSQIEYRIMLGLAANYWNGLIKSGALVGVAEQEAKTKDLTSLIDNLNNWEKDYHREGGSIFAGCTPDTMTKEQRKKVKAIHFSVPYGAEAMSVAKPRLAGVPESEQGEIIAETEADLAAWRNKLYPLYYYLEHVRDQALTPIKTNPPAHEGTYGKVSNALGRYRLFKLDNLTFKDKGAIRRQAGNYPIQSLARDIFFSGMIKLYGQLHRDGLIADKFEDSKVILNLFVHDEVVLQVHKSVHPYRMYKYIMDTNLTKLKGHPTYFMGIAVVNNWGQGKSDKFEAPIAYVQECIAKYDADPEKYNHIDGDLKGIDYGVEALEGITHWFAGRVCRELKSVLDDKTVIDPAYLDKKLLNYYVKPRLAYYASPCRKTEYLEDPQLSASANKLMKYIDSYLLETGEYKNYQLLFNGQVIPYEEVLQFSSQTEESADFDFDLDMLDLSEAEEDYIEKEQDVANEYYLLNDPDIAINQYQWEPPLEEDTNETELPALWSEDKEGHIVFFVQGLSQEQFQHLTKFLLQYRVPDGKPLFFFNGHNVDSGVRINIDFTRQQVYEAVFGQVSTTSIFGR